MGDERLKSIELLSELRAGYSCFDEKEEPYYRALSLAIAYIREKMDADNEEQALDKAIAKITDLADADAYGDRQYGFSEGLWKALEIIDKYKAGESNLSEKPTGSESEDDKCS